MTDYSLRNAFNEVRASRLGTNGLFSVFDGSKRTDAEIAAGVFPTYYFYPPGDVRRYGAVLDGATDDTTALTNWAAVGGNLTWPVVATAKVTSAIPFVSNTRVEAVVGATIRQYTANANVAQANSKTNIRISGLTFYAVGSMSSTFNGQGFFATGCTYVDLEDCVVTNHRGFGIMFYNSPHCRARFNRLINSPVANDDAWSNVGGDIAIEGNSSYCEIVLNECISGNGVALQIQPLANTDSASYNIIANNTVANPKMYGVNVYLGDPAATMVGNIVTGNTIKNVTGYIYFTAPGTYPFGAGIYSNGGTDLVVSDNSVDGANTAALSWTDNLAQGGIGLTNVGKAIVSGNTIKSCGQYGITIRDPGALAPARQQTIVSDNLVSNTTNIGIQVKEKANVSIINNQVDTCATTGIHIDNTTTLRQGVTVRGNSVRDITGSAILVSWCKNVLVSDNDTYTSSIHGIYIANCQDLVANGNTVNQHVTYGIAIDTVTRYAMAGNAVNGTGTSTYGYGLFSRATGMGTIDPQSNIVANCVTAFIGDYIPFYAAAPTTGTWAKGDFVHDITAVSAGYARRVCTVAGTPGTWKQEGLIT